MICVCWYLAMNDFSIWTYCPQTLINISTDPASAVETCLFAGRLNAGSKKLDWMKVNLEMDYMNSLFVVEEILIQTTTANRRFE